MAGPDEPSPCPWSLGHMVTGHFEFKEEGGKLKLHTSHPDCGESLEKTLVRCNGMHEMVYLCKLTNNKLQKCVMDLFHLTDPHPLISSHQAQPCVRLVYLVQ